jgi:hypothetical protein
MMQARGRCRWLVLDANAGGLAVDQVVSVGEHAQDLSHLTGVLVGNAFGLAEEARGGKQVLETEDQTRKLVTKIGK